MTQSIRGRFAFACAIMIPIAAAHAAPAELDTADRRKYAEATDLVQNWTGSGDHLQRAFAILVELGQRNPRSAYPIAGLAEIKYRLYGYQASSLAEVLDLADRAIKLDPENADAHVVYSKATLEQGQVDAAARAAKRAIELAPAKPEAMFQNAKVAERAKNHGEAEKWYRMAIDRLPHRQRRSNVYFHMAKMFSEMTPVEVGKATEAYSRAADLTEDSIPILNDSATFLMHHTERYDQAIGYLNKALRVASYRNGHINLGLAHFYKWGHAVFHPERYRDAKQQPLTPEQITAATGVSKESAFAMNPTVTNKPYATLAMLKLGMIKDVDVFPENCECPDNALIASAHGNHADLVRMLVEKGANVNAVDLKYGSTALFYAVRYQNIDLVRYLLEHGARINLEDRHGKLLLEYAIADAKPADASVLGMLLEKGGDADALTRAGNPLIAVAVMHGKPAALDLLVRRYRADPDARTGGARGVPLLALAAANSHADGSQIVKILLQAGANPWVKYGGGDVLHSLKASGEAHASGAQPSPAEAAMARARAANISMLEEARRRIAKPASF